jgi:RNA polymerase sigma factor (sigma-70 family)
MLINYKDADGKTHELEVTEEVGNFYLDSLKSEKSNDRSYLRRNTPLSVFNHEDEEYFGSGEDICAEIADRDELSRIMVHLLERQRLLLEKVYVEGMSYAEIARQEGKDPSSIRHAVERAIKSARKFL